MTFTTKSSERHYLKVVSIVAEQFTTKFLQCTQDRQSVMTPLSRNLSKPTKVEKIATVKSLINEI